MKNPLPLLWDAAWSAPQIRLPSRHKNSGDAHGQRGGEIRSPESLEIRAHCTRSPPGAVILSGVHPAGQHRRSAPAVS